MYQRKKEGKIEIKKLIKKERSECLNKKKQETNKAKE